MRTHLPTKLTILAAALFLGVQCSRSAPALSPVWKWKPGQERRYRLELHREMKDVIRQSGGIFGLSYEERSDQVWRLRAVRIESDGTVSLEVTYESVKARMQLEENGPFFEFDSRTPNENPENPVIQGHLENVGKTFRVQMWQRGDVWQSAGQPEDDKWWSATALNLSGYNLSNRIVASSLDALFSRWCPREALGNRRSWELRHSTPVPGVGSTEFLFQFRLLDLKDANDRNLGISETITQTLLKAESRPGAEKGDPENDPMLLHQRLTGYSGEGKGEMWFDPDEGNIRRLVESFTDKTTTTTGYGTRSLETTLELLPP